ncbi:hypothetical protein SK128_020852 [Halocaridina rubra]|uniref:Uncharacterized protein n=1 Tax=Halocaridina rubra TaxID=373956 RepID=A0AAN8WKS6_HALRR
MISSPMIVMGVLAIGVTIGYLGVSNYQLRQESFEVASVAEKNDYSLEQAIQEANKQYENIKAKLARSEEALKKINDEKNMIQEDMHRTEETGADEMVRVNEDQDKVFIELDEAEYKIANLTSKLMELTGQSPVPLEGSFLPTVYAEDSSIFEDVTDEVTRSEAS